MSAETKLQYKQVEESDVVTEAHLDRTVTVNLTETPTFWLFEMIGVCVSSESEEADAVRNSNELYKEVRRMRTSCSGGRVTNAVGTIFRKIFVRTRARRIY